MLISKQNKILRNIFYNFGQKLAQLHYGMNVDVLQRYQLDRNTHTMNVAVGCHLEYKDCI